MKFQANKPFVYLAKPKPSGSKPKIYIMLYVKEGTDVFKRPIEAVDSGKSFDILTLELTPPKDAQSYEWIEVTHEVHKEDKDRIKIKTTIMPSKGAFGPEEGGETTVHYDDPDNWPPNA